MESAWAGSGVVFVAGVFRRPNCHVYLTLKNVFFMGKVFKKGDYKPAERSTKRNPKRKSCAVPNQSLTIGQILDKYSRGIPVDITQSEGVYLPQDEFDMEKLNRADFGEKRAFAQQMQQRAADIKNELLENERTKKANEKKARDAAAAAAANNGPGIGPLDNTMPGDTSKTIK